jgi:hypothetical protein
MWNHRRLDDPVQEQIESIIRDGVPSYTYGSRREDQSDIIRSSALFSEPIRISADVIHQQTISECVEAWRSHATLERQAGVHFTQVVQEIDSYLKSLRVETIEIPYTTNIWLAQLR